MEYSKKCIQKIKVGLQTHLNFLYNFINTTFIIEKDLKKLIEESGVKKKS